MTGWLAYAETADTGEATVLLLVICCAILGAVAAMAIVPPILAIRFGRRANVIGTLVVFWGMVAAGSLINTAINESRWSHEENLRLLSGYADVQALKQEQPRWPWEIWIGLAGAYGGLLVWPLARGPKEARRS